MRLARPAAARLAVPSPVCDGCRAADAAGPWHAGDDGAHFCAACHVASVVLAGSTGIR